MNNRYYFFGFVFSIIILGLFSTCGDSSTPTPISQTPQIPQTPQTPQYTVKFEANGGIPSPADQIVNKGDKVDSPAFMTKTGYGFGGWYKDRLFNNEWDFDTDTVTGNITLYAKWDNNYYIVSFEANGGTPVPSQQNIAYGSKIVMPPAMTKTDYAFGGWYKDEAFLNIWNLDHDVITGNITLYAKWIPPIIVPGTNWNAKIRWLDANVQSNNNYIIELVSNENIEQSTNFSFSGKTNISITLKGIGSIPVIISSSSGLFEINASVTLILDNNLELKGKINVSSGGNLILNNGVRLTSGAYNNNGVYVNNGGTFTMNGGEISGNTCSSSGSYPSPGYSYGGGVYVEGTFTMNDGRISDNKCSSSGSGLYPGYSYGGGVYVSGTFTMNGGEISGNNIITTSINSGSAYSCGGGVYVEGTFTMNGGKISGNISSSSSSASYGGGVYVKGTFTMNNGEISSNISSSSYSYQTYGGGVYLDRNGSFNKKGGTIYGYTEGNSNNNVVKDSSGVVQQKQGHAIYIDHDNSVYKMGKDSTSGTTDNLSFNGKVNPPAWSGDWDF